MFVFVVKPRCMHSNDVLKAWRMVKVSPFTSMEKALQNVLIVFKGFDVVNVRKPQI
jgi:hypothetical protein